MEYDIFISYSGADHVIVDAFVHQLESAGYKVWIDRAGIYSGTRFKSVLVKAIENSRVFLFFSSKESNASQWTAKEIAIAVDRQKTIIPIKIDNTRYNSDVEFDLINLDFVDYHNQSNRAQECDKLMRTLERIFGVKRPYDPQQMIANSKTEDKEIARFSFIKKNRGCVISIALMSLLLIVGIPVFFTANDSSKPYEYRENTVNACPPPSSEDYSSEYDGTSSNDDNYYAVAAEPQLIDLGLPSGTLWLDRNVGASSPEEPGMYFSWGETKEKDEYSIETYFSKERIDGEYSWPKIVSKEISGTKYDAATVILGSDYRMPTKDDMKELIKSCTWEYESFNGKPGFKVIGPNDQFIFLPDCGFMQSVSLKGIDAYWTSTITSGFSPWTLIIEGQINRYELNDYMSVENGLPIRPVSKK